MGVGNRAWWGAVFGEACAFRLPVSLALLAGMVLQVELCPPKIYVEVLTQVSANVSSFGNRIFTRRFG